MSAHGLTLDGQQICNASVTLLAAYTDSASGELWLSLSVVLNEPTHILWRASDLDRLNLEREVPGCICVDERGRSTRRLIDTYLRAQLSQPNLSRGAYISQTGWQEMDGKFRFLAGETASQSLAASAAIGGLPPPWISAPEVARIHLAADPHMPEEEAVERLLQNLWRYADVYLPIWGFTLFSILRSFLQDCGLPTACILYLIAPQGFGKTTAAKRLCQIFDTEKGVLADVYDAGSSVAAMQDVLIHARDRPVLFDDVFISSNKSKQRERRNSAAELLRFAANETRVTKMRGAKEVPIDCAASLVVTGEIPFEAKSDVTRCIIVRIGHQLTGDSDDLRTFAATAMRSFLAWFGHHYDDFRVQIKHDFQQFCSNATSDTEPRVQKSLFTLYWLLARFWDYAIEIGAAASSAKPALIDASERALKKVWENIQSELRRIENRPRSLAEVIAEGIRTKQLPAFEHAGCVCVRTEELVAYLQRAYQRSDLSAHFVAPALRRLNLLSLDNTGKSTKKIAGRRYLCFPYSSLC